MSPVVLVALWRAEVLKLSSRLTARVGLVVSALLGIGLPVMLWGLGSSSIMWNNEPLSEILTLDAANGTIWALRVRNFYVMRAFVLVLAALSFAGELDARTLREDLLRPVPRWAILLAKQGALATWIAATLALPWVLGVVVGGVLLGLDGSWGPSMKGYLATFAADVGFATLALAVAVVARSVAAAIAGVFLFLVLDTMLGWALYALRGIRNNLLADVSDLPWAVDAVLQSIPWLPSSAFGVWLELVNSAEPTWQSWTSLLVITLLSMVVAERFFARTDIL